jgi:hypothetical protein
MTSPSSSCCARCRAGFSDAPSQARTSDASCSFADEEVVHRSLGDAGDFDDAVERGVVEAVGGELL